MKLVLLLLVLMCCYNLSYIQTQQQYSTIWTSAHFDGVKFVWSPTINLKIGQSLFDHPLFYLVRLKRGLRLTAHHSKVLRKLLIAAGDVEKNPGPINSQSAMTSQSESVIQPISQSDQTPSASTDQSKQTEISQSNLRMKCSSCEKTFARKSDLMRHHRSKHQNQKFPCLSCQYVTDRKDILKRHTDFIHGEGPSKRLRIEAPIAPLADSFPAAASMVTTPRPARQRKEALKGELKTYQLQADEGERDLELFLNAKSQEIGNYVDDELVGRTGIKILMNPRLEFFKPVHPEEITANYFSHKPIEIFRGSDVATEIQAAFPPILKAVEEFTREGSGWAIQKILTIDIHIARLGITRGFSYKRLPKNLSNKKAIINIKNRDNKCFMWSILAKLHPITKNPQSVNKYKQYDQELNFDGLDFPIKIKDISKIETINGLAINLYGYDDEVGLHPLRMSKQTSGRWIHLLLYNGHYSLIKNLDRLLFDQRGYQHKKYFCPRCLTAKYSETDRKAHYEVCCKEEPTKTIMPLDTELKFKNYKKMLRQPLVLYADFECLTEKIEGPRRGNNTGVQLIGDATESTEKIETLWS